MAFAQCSSYTVDIILWLYLSQVNNLRAQEMNAEVQGLRSGGQNRINSSLGAGASVAIACGKPIHV